MGDTNPRRIVLSPNASSQTNQVATYGSGQATTEPGPLLGGNNTQDAQSAIAIALDAALTSVGPASPRPFGVSDPVLGYQPGTVTTNGAGEPQYASPHLRPADVTNGDPQMLINQTIPGYRTVHLQRLANPQIPWNAITNPYMTIDSASVDVTAFNGVSSTQDPVPGGANPQPIQTTPFCSTQRGDQYALPAAAWPPSLASQPNLLWAHEYSHVAGAGVLSIARPVTPTTALNPAPMFTPALYHSIGYLNQEYGISSTQNTAYTAAASTAYTSTNYAAPSPYLGMPKTPFPWLTWNNRPYTTPLELALVPKSRSSRLLYDYSATAPATASTTMYSSQSGAIMLYPNPQPPLGTGGFSSSVQGNATAPFFGHLLNFFDDASPMPANLFRLFEYVQVPSRFVGTDTVLSPVGSNYGVMNSTTQTLASPPVKPTLLTGDAVPGGTPPTWSAPTNPTYTLGSSPTGTYLRPPLNKVSEYRDPGRVNINTVQDARVWQGVLNGNYYPQLAPPTSGSGAIPNVAMTIQTLANASTTPAVANAAGTPVPTNMPSYFTNPFRSFSGAALTNSIYAPANVRHIPRPSMCSPTRCTTSTPRCCGPP